MKTPVLLLVFKRLDTLKQVIEVLQHVKPERIFVAADGPRQGRLHEAAEVRVVREYVLANLNWPCKIETLFRDENLGCGVAVSNAIEWFFSNVDRGIILEDDCVPHETFFNYCDELLERYLEDDSIMSISGTHFGEPAAIRSDYYYSKYPLMWGWATWKRAWKHFDFKPTDWEEVLDRQTHLSFRARLYWRRIFSKLHPNQTDIWDYQWLLTVWRRNGLVCRPKLNLVKNVGFGPGATHTYLSNNKCAQLLPNPLPMPYIAPVEKVIFTSGDKAAERDWMNLSLKSFFGLYFPTTSSLIKRLLRRKS